MDHAAESNGRVFYGRDSFFPTLDAKLQEAGIVFMYGAPQMGKTAVLHEIAAGRLGERYLPLELDLAPFAHNSLSLFWWDLAEAAAASAETLGITLPPRTRSVFVANPYGAFESQLLEPLIDLGRGLADEPVRPLFLLDNAQVILTRLPDLADSTNTLSAEAQAFFSRDDICAVVASSHAYDSLPTTARDVLADPAQIELGPLSRQEALTTMRNTEAYTLAPDVADYIYQSTGGAPAALYALRTGLEEYTRDNGWQQLQVTDVLTVQHRLQEKTALKATVYRLPPSGEQAIAIRQARRQHWWQQMRLPLLVGLVILAMMLLGLYGSTRSDSTQVANAAILGDKPTPTPTFEPTPTEAPTQTPEPTPTAEPEDAAISAETPTPDQPPTPTMEPTSVISLPPGVPYPSTAVREPDDMPMRYIPAGTFTMGSAENDFTANVDEKPQHEVTLDAYYIDQYEVSVSQFAAFLNQISQLEDPSAVCDPVDCALPSSRAGFTSYLLDEDLGDGTIQYVAQAGYGSYPANHISWYGARAYCQWVGGRLPTEAEWEYAARGDDGRTYPWGEETPNPNLAVFNSESFYDLKPVDALPDGASPFGVEGMAGSVWEWTADWYSETEYERSSAVNPTGPETGLSKVMRGGSWPFNNGPDRLRTANRNSITPDFFSATIGFRCVVDPE